MSELDHEVHHATRTYLMKTESEHPETDAGPNARKMAAIIMVGVVAAIIVNRNFQDWMASAIVGSVLSLVIVALLGTGHAKRQRTPPTDRHLH